MKYSLEQILPFSVITEVFLEDNYYVNGLHVPYA